MKNKKNEKNEKEIRVVTIKGVCEMLKCSRTTYYTYRNMLKTVPNESGNIYHLESDVLRLKAELEEKERDKHIVKTELGNLKIVC